MLAVNLARAPLSTLNPATIATAVRAFAGEWREGADAGASGGGLKAKGRGQDDVAMSEIKIARLQTSDADGVNPNHWGEHSKFDLLGGTQRKAL